MPKLPQYESQRQLTTQQPQHLRTGAGQKNLYDVAGETAGQTANIAIRWKQAIDTIQTTTASANMKSGLVDIMNRAENDIDYNNADAYIKEIGQLKEESLKGFTNPDARANAALALDYDAQVATIKAQNIFKKKAVEAGQVAAFKLIDLEVSNYVNAPDDTIKAQSASNIKSIIDAQIANGIFGRKEGHKLYEDSIKEAQQVVKDQEGIRKKQEKEIQLAQDFARSQREEDLIKYRINMTDNEGNPVSLNDLNEMVRADMNGGQVDPKFAQAYLNSLKTVKTAKPEKLDSIRRYNELMLKDQVLHDKEWGWRNASFGERAKYRADVLGAYNDGLITKEQMDTLFQGHADAFKRDPTIKKAINGVINQSNAYDTEEDKATAKAEMHFNLVNKIIDGKAPDVALGEVIDEMNNKMNPDWSNYKLDQKIKLPSGTWKVIDFEANGEPILEKL